MKKYVSEKVLKYKMYLPIIHIRWGNGALENPRIVILNPNVTLRTPKEGKRHLPSKMLTKEGLANTITDLRGKQEAQFRNAWLFVQ